MLCPTGLGNEGTEREQAFVAVHAVISGYVVTNQSPLNIWHSNVKGI